uniref:Uncharacterized protein n=1 Tax=Vespula pensylvanica TaxID=30213 RepID=A0A834JQ38_VESPE|nr:hypothetical protein H0235_017453 [Vespula pensylvanica]
MNFYELQVERKKNDYCAIENEIKTIENELGQQAIQQKTLISLSFLREPAIFYNLQIRFQSFGFIYIAASLCSLLILIMNYLYTGIIRYGYIEVKLWEIWNLMN